MVAISVTTLGRDEAENDNDYDGRGVETRTRSAYRGELVAIVEGRRDTDEDAVKQLKTIGRVNGVVVGRSGTFVRVSSDPLVSERITSKGGVWTSPLQHLDDEIAERAEELDDDELLIVDDLYTDEDGWEKRVTEKTGTSP